MQGTGIQFFGLSMNASQLTLSVSDNRRHLVRNTGEGFFLLGDTAWELFHRLSREEAEHFLTVRAKQGFNMILAVALAEFDGLHTPNFYGHTPLRGDDPRQPNEDYFSHVDWIVNKANTLGLLVGLLPTWGDKWTANWGTGPLVFDASNARDYGAWIARRYKHAGIIWVLGGDRPVNGPEQRTILDQMAAGIRSQDERHLITFHPCGGQSALFALPNCEWLDFSLLQSGHCTSCVANYQQITDDYHRTPTRPIMDGEPCYEDHPIMSFRWQPTGPYFGAYEARRAAWWSVMSGSAGHVYGCHPVWQMYDPSRHPVINSARTPWPQAIQLPGAEQMRHVKDLMLSRPMLTRVPDQSVLCGNDWGTSPGHAAACRDSMGRYLMAYAPLGNTLRINLDLLTGERVQPWWYDVRTGAATKLEGLPRRGTKDFVPPAEEPDWLLVVDDAAAGFSAPGSSTQQ